MAFDWAAYLDLARELAIPGAGPPLEEARLRSAISRSYYAAFKTAFNCLCSTNPAARFQREGAHQYVFERFRYHPDPARQNIGTGLERLRRMRNQADYDDEMADLPGDTRMALAYAADILAGLDRLT